MDRRQKPSGITIADLQNAHAEARRPEPAKRTSTYWAIRKQLQWEARRKIVEGQKRARRAGVRIGRPPNKAFGDRIAQMRDNGMLWREICAKLNLTMGTACRRYVRYMKDKGLRTWAY